MFIDKRRTHLFGAVLALLALSSSFGASAASTVVNREFASPALKRTWTYVVYSPANYEPTKLRYPVLYLLHGNGQKGSDWVTSGKIQTTADALIANREIPPVIIVMPDAGTTWFVDRKEQMESAFIQDLIPEIEKNFSAIASREGRLVGGLSMGGYGSTRFALKYPEKFIAAALLSPAIYDPEPPSTSGARRVGVFGAPAYDTEIWKSLNYPSLWPSYLAKKMPVAMYIVSGDDDDFFIESDATNFYSLLRKNQQPAELRIVNGAHVWPVWESTIGDALKYVFKYAAQPTPLEANQR
ncbi:MAG: esterase family protein [Candidatus Obscuribacterales bacterium]|nr:esterase family protein [Steroidobacteraceae bacterium]